MKLLLASFATGIVITTGLFITVVFVRALFRDEASVMIALWVFAWPVWFLRRVPAIPLNSLIWLSFAIGMLLDAVFISIGTYCVLRVIVRRRKRARI